MEDKREGRGGATRNDVHAAFMEAWEAAGSAAALDCILEYVLDAVRLEIVEDLEDLAAAERAGAEKPTKLARCPFCGGEAEAEAAAPMYGKTGAWVRCKKCGTAGPMFGVSEVLIKDGKLETPVTLRAWAEGMQRARAAWNTRKGASA